MSAKTSTMMGRPQPLNASVMPKSQQTYSEWILERVAPKVTMENPEQGIKRYNENKEIYWSAYADWAVENVEQMSETLFLFMFDNKNWITEKFPIVLSNATRYVQKIMNINQEMPDIQTRKVPARNISATIYTREAHAAYTSQGFQMDYDVMKTPMGRREFDMKVEAVVANLGVFVMYQSVSAMLYTPSFYITPNQLYAFKDVPRTVDELYNLHERRRMFIINKSEFSFDEIVASADRIFNQKQKKAAGIIMSRDDFWYLQARNPTMNYRDKSGPVALRNRLNAGQQQVIDGIQLYPVPLVCGRLHDPLFTPLLEHPIALGGFVRFPELTHHLAPEEYASDMRNVKMAAISTNCMNLYKLCDVIAHSLEFYPPNDKHGRGGQINRPLLQDMINVHDDLFNKNMSTTLKGNEKHMNPLVAYDNDPTYAVYTNQGLKRYRVVDMIGEIETCQFSHKNMVPVAQTMLVHMTRHLSKDELNTFERGLVLASELTKLDPSRYHNYIQTIAAATAADLVNLGETTIKMKKPNRFGGPVLDANSLTTAGVANVRPYGMGTISGFMTVDAFSKHNDAVFDKKDVAVITQFVRIYKSMVSQLIEACPDNPCLAPSMVPMHHNSHEMSDFTRIMIVAWYTLFMPFVPPMGVQTGASPSKLIVQLSIETGTTIGRTKYQPASMIEKNTSDGLKVESMDAEPFGDFISSSLFGGTLFGFLNFVHPQLPVLAKTNASAKAELQKNINGSLLTLNMNNANLAFMSLHVPYDTAHANHMCTRAFYDELMNMKLLKEFPAALLQMLAYPLAHDTKTPTVFETRMATSALAPRLLGIAMRAVMFCRANVATVKAFTENNIRIPFGAMIIRPFETQICHSAIVVAEGVIGETNFSGYDNTLTFDPLHKHFSIQAFTQVAAVVKDNEKYVFMPAVRGGVFLGGKGHMFVNQGMDEHIAENEELVQAIHTCNGEQLGNKSCIPTLTSYNYAVEKQETRHFDLRNRFHRGDFPGRLEDSRDFTDTRSTLAYPAAPLLNHVFRWTYDSNAYINRMNFSQMMQGRMRNHIVSETLSHVWSPEGRWAKTMSYHVWGETEQDGCRDTQQSHASVVKTN